MYVEKTFVVRRHMAKILFDVCFKKGARQSFYLSCAGTCQSFFSIMILHLFQVWKGEKIFCRVWRKKRMANLANKSFVVRF